MDVIVFQPSPLGWFATNFNHMSETVAPYKIEHNEEEEDIQVDLRRSIENISWLHIVIPDGSGLKNRLLLEHVGGTDEVEDTCPLEPVKSTLSKLGVVGGWLPVELGQQIFVYPVSNAEIGSRDRV